MKMRQHILLFTQTISYKQKFEIKIINTRNLENKRINF